MIVNTLLGVVLYVPVPCIFVFWKVRVGKREHNDLIKNICSVKSGATSTCMNVVSLLCPHTASNVCQEPSHFILMPTLWGRGS